MRKHHGSGPDALHTPITLGSLSLRNRIIAAPDASSDVDRGGSPLPRVGPIYAQAAAAAGLVLAAPAWIAPDGAGALRSSGIARESHVAAWSTVTTAVHAAGGLVALPLWHAGRLSHPRVQPHGGWPIAPSAIAAPGEIVTPEGPRPYPVPRSLDASELPALVASYATAAEWARRAGFDAVEIVAAQGGLLEQFLRPESNQRSDAHGGSATNRARLLVEIVDAVSERIGAGRVAVRLGAGEAEVATWLSGRGLGWLHLVPPAGADDLAEHTGHLRSRVDTPVMLGSGVAREPARYAIASGAADAVVVAPDHDDAALTVVPDIASALLGHPDIWAANGAAPRDAQPDGGTAHA